MSGRTSGVDLIAAERQRQIDVEGWTPDHDDEHVPGTIARAANCYVDAASELMAGLTPSRRPSSWPPQWHDSWWKPSDDPIRNLVKAGALIAAEIDRLQRARAQGSQPMSGEQKGGSGPLVVKHRLSEGRWTEVTQTILHGDIEGVGGNCFQAAIASVLNMPIEAVPHFVQFTWWPLALELWARGLAPEGLTYKDQYSDDIEIPDRLCLVYGPAERGVDHVVVGYKGQIVWDPHPSRAGLLKVNGVGWFEKWTHNDNACWACKRPHSVDAGGDR